MHLLGLAVLAIHRDACTHAPTPAPTTPAPTTSEPTTPAPTTSEPTTPAPTTAAPFSLCKTLVDGKKVYLAQMVGDAKKYLGYTYCANCPANAYAYKSIARVNKWWHPITVATIPNGSLGLKMDNGRFYSRCETCGNAANNVVQRYTNWQASTSTHWTCQDVSETQLRLQDFKGEYMTRREFFGSIDGHFVYSSPLNATDDGQLWTVALTAP
ncbi:hypothetical protein SDRG_15314 [Saprolegnia diclina VS20]|uniref:Ricin B lectin domain-containing protein n=1 Tax=Saprolegnia diclina (strain VS20) TaxID=1156394 RepID=T0PXB7_SAPDV|nr:hypothetical protein SDRG_15314 [Saprolegnia diclina VS20]EQC26891.1 hypothetical protein SDRG_15314 [Saprolegnia diclina VS20]|eukprot:XP_008619704.1 hypothetical protein SDRG_15314 [Saprolegnia diclina VS20]